MLATVAEAVLLFFLLDLKPWAEIVGKVNWAEMEAPPDEPTANVVTSFVSW